jgi:hypothetical protein
MEKKFRVTATKIINLETVVRAENQEQVEEFLSDWIVDDFTQVGAEFTIDYIEEEED